MRLYGLLCCGLGNGWRINSNDSGHRVTVTLRLPRGAIRDAPNAGQINSNDSGCGVTVTLRMNGPLKIKLQPQNHRRDPKWVSDPKWV